MVLADRATCVCPPQGRKILVLLRSMIFDADYLAYMLKYDSTYGQFKGTVEGKGNELIVNGKIF